MVWSGSGWKPSENFTWENRDDPGDLRVKRVVGSPHPKYPNLVWSGSGWKPSENFTWENSGDPGDLRVKRVVGSPHPNDSNVVWSGSGWKPSENFTWKNPGDPGDLSVVPVEIARSSGNGFIGGTGWITGYSRPSDASPELRDKLARLFQANAELTGSAYGAAVDLERYNFVLGIGQTATLFQDLATRVVFDQFSNGAFSAAMQEGYNSLKGRAFDELACHSNGAMICLAALENRDLTADRVVLYGPQISTESLEMWQALIESRRIRSVQIYLNQNDPVPALSMLLGSRDPVSAGRNLSLFDTDVMRGMIARVAPSIGVKTFACDASILTADCHDMRVYRFARGCDRASSGETVPGTAFRGGRGVLEPPPPC